jgi:Amt family ammonium transporter
MKPRLLIFAALGCAILSGQSPDAATKAAIAAAQSAGDNAWVLMSAALVLMMTGPGLALFYGGLVRRKNVLGIMVQSFAMMAVITVLWAVCGYSLAFGEGNPFLGDLRYLFLGGVGAAPNDAYAPTIPQSTFMVYQMMFAIITPALITGAYAERVKFSAMLLFSILWTLVVYIPLAHMVWGKGGLLSAYGGGSIPVLDFAGGTVVHISSGVSALVTALYLGRRIGYPEQTRPHSLVLCFIGACLLWVGWFGFNAGSALAASGLASSAFVNTHLASAMGALAWMGAEWMRNGKPSVLGIVSGSVAGLATITQASGFVQPAAAMLIGGTAGAVCYYMVARVKERFGYDDSLDAFGVHGVGGTMGCLFTGAFATNKINDALKGSNGQPLPLGLVDGNAAQIGNQAIGAAIGIGLAMVGTWVILKICDMVVGVRVDRQQEIAGLDIGLHGEEGYNLDS